MARTIGSICRLWLIRPDVCAPFALLTTHANGLNQAANLQIRGWPQKSRFDHTQACVSQIPTITSMYSPVRAQQPRGALSRAAHPSKSANYARVVCLNSDSPP